MNATPPSEKESKSEMSIKALSILGKVALMGLVTLLLLIPLALVRGVITERQERADTAAGDIAQSWAKEQRLIGPLLVVPYHIKHSPDIDYAYFLPENYHVQGQMKPEVRYRGIFETVVYNTDLTLDGTFAVPNTAGLNITADSLIPQDAFIALRVADTRGVQKQDGLQWNQKRLVFTPGVLHKSDPATALITKVNVPQAGQSIPFRITLSLNGSKSLHIMPIGKTNTILLASPWADPSFTGQFLPSQRQVTSKGFEAQWDVSYFGRNFPQSWVGAENVHRLTTDTEAYRTEPYLGVTLISPVDFYREAERATKYGILFIVLTFITYFLFEVLVPFRMHPFQYILIAFAMCLFYLLLVSLAEVVGFLPAYIMATLPTVTLIAAYTHAIAKHKNRRMSAIMAVVLLVLYTYLYILLRMEDWSLLAGAIGLFLALATIMYLTRRVDWYSGNTHHSENA